MSYTQWDKGFLEGYRCGQERELREVREALLEAKGVPIEVFEILNKLSDEVKEAKEEL